MNERESWADFAAPCGRIKPMHAVNLGPRQGGPHLPYDNTAQYREIGIPYVRLHDVEYPYGSNQFVDIHCIFPDFDADENDEASYNFRPTDAYLDAILKAGGIPFYRLGESIDHFPRKLHIHPPKDFGKWARICEHIILHYNYGWADGFSYGLKYWEIWNEPDGGSGAMWSGTGAQFFDLYRITANHLRTRFPEISIGGYASCGFYSVSREDPGTVWFSKLVPWMRAFLDYITAPATRAPLDFFSWHCYADRPEEIAIQEAFVREELRRRGLAGCESILDEYNTLYSLSGPVGSRPEFAADLAAGMITAQKSTPDILFYYATGRWQYNGLWTVEQEAVRLLPAFWSMQWFGDLYRLGTQVKTGGDLPGELYTLAATNGQTGQVLLASRAFAGPLTLRVSGEYLACTLECVSALEAPTAVSLPVADGTVTFSLRKNSVCRLTFGKGAASPIDAPLYSSVEGRRILKL